MLDLDQFSYTYQEMLKSGEDALMEAGIAEPDSNAWILFSYAFHIDRFAFMCNCIEWEVQKEDIKKKYDSYLTMIHERIEGTPVQYITHEQNFYGYDFYVDERVLIPRQDTEVLVECVQQQMQQKMLRKQSADCGKLLDVCTGSGCIAITLANVLQWEEVLGTDVSLDALAVAKKNGDRLNHNVKFLQSDLFEKIEGKFDVIVSNPPYIPSEVIETLSTEVKDFEPRLALDGTKDGLFFYRKIIDQARKYLKKEGLLFFEIGFDQAEEVKALFYEFGYEDVRIVTDLAGLNRVVYASYENAAIED